MLFFENKVCLVSGGGQESEKPGRRDLTAREGAKSKQSLISILPAGQAVVDHQKRSGEAIFYKADSPSQMKQ